MPERDSVAQPPTAKPVTPSRPMMPTSRPRLPGPPATDRGEATRSGEVDRVDAACWPSRAARGAARSTGHRMWPSAARRPARDELRQDAVQGPAADRCFGIALPCRGQERQPSLEPSAPVCRRTMRLSLGRARANVLIFSMGSSIPWLGHATLKRTRALRWSSGAR